MAEFSENWDPMREDYYNDTINSYDTGPGSRLPRNQQPANFRKSESQPVKLYLFPMDGYTKESLNNIFSRFGEVTEVYIDARAHKWAFVSMKTQAAAERALREVSNHPQLRFKCQYAKEKTELSASVSEAGSPAEVNLRRTEDMPQTGPQFINNFKQKSMSDRGSMGDRGVPETSERRFLPNFQFSKTLFPVAEKKPNNLNNGYQEPVSMNGVAQPVPSCYYCKRQTLETCTRCFHPFCSRKCMILGYEGHDKNCIVTPIHSADRTAQPPAQSKVPMTMPQPTPGMMPQPTPGMMPQPAPGMMPQSAPVMNGQPYDPYSRTICEEFADTSRNYVNSFKQPPASVNVSNSYRTEDNDYHVRSGENHSQNFHDRRAPVSNEYNKSETYRPNNSSESQRRSENVQTNGSHRMNDYQSGRESATRSKPSADDDDCPNIEFDLSSKAGMRPPGRRERDGKGHRSGKENGSPWDSQTPGSGYRSSNEYETSRPKKENETSWDSRTPGSGHRSSNEYETSRPKRENESSRNSRGSPPSGHRSSRENTSRDKRDNRDEGSGHRSSQQRESWDDRSQASGYRPSKENASRDSRGDGSERRPKRESWDDQSHESGNRARKENDSTWDNRSKGSGYRPNENASPRDRQPPASNYRSNPENGSSWNELSRNQSNKENEPSWDNRSQTSRRSHRETVPSRDNESPVSEFAGNRSSSEMKSDDNPRRRSGSFDHSERNSSSRSKDPELPRFFRERIEERSRFKVKLAENGPMAVMIQSESNSLNEMIDALQKFYREPLTELYKGMKCIARQTPGDHNTWYRCMLHEIDPFSVRFIDFSHEPVLVRKDDVRIMPEPFRLLSPYCYRVEFMNVEPEELVELRNDDAVLEVEFLRKEMYKWQVNLVRKPFEEELKEARSIRDAKKQSESPRRPSSNINNHPELKVVLKEDTPIEVTVTHIENKSKIFVTVWDKVEKLMKLITESNCSSLSELKDLRLNTTCLSLYENIWYRARIVCMDPLTVFYIDFGNTESADRKNLKIVPDKLLWIEPLVVAIRFRNEPNSPITVDQAIKIIPIEELSAEKVWIVRLASEPEAPVQRSSMPEPTSEEVMEKSNAPKVEVGEILDVQVTFTISNSEYYVGPKDIVDKMKLLAMEDTDVKPAGSLKNISLGMQCVKEFDGVWSRAKIVKLDPLTIFFVDFGNLEKVNQKDLYPCPERLRKTPALAYKICLQEPRNLEEYVAYKIKKVSDKFWSVVDEPPFAPKANSSVS